MVKRNGRTKKSENHRVRRPLLDVGAFRGKWLAIDPKTYGIVGHGGSMEEARQSAASIAPEEPVLYFVPQSDAFFVGGAK